MKRFLWIALLIVTVIATACGGASTPAPAPTAAPAAAEAPTAAPAATEAPAAAPTEAPAATEAPKAAEAPAATEAPAAAPAAAGAYTEAPMLAEQVKAGKLPPIEQRLPEKPLVVGPGTYLTKENLPDWQPGVYGGTLRGAHSSANWAPDFFVAIDEPFLAAPKISDQGIYANVAESFKVENNNQDFTFTMRKGMKWSDGEPVTTEDVRFTYEDILLNDKITPIFPAKFRVGFKADGDPMKLEIVDDYTFKVHFSAPYGGFLRALAIEGWVGYTDFINPAHYLKQYHIKYTKLDDPKMQEALKTLNLKDEWWQVFTNKRCQNWDMSNPKCADYPSLYPWVITDSGSPNILKFNRNPYYFKVDTKGQQLPYIDTLVSQQVENVEMVNMKVFTGDVDFLRESTALVKMPLYKENEDKAGFRVQLLDMHVDSSGLVMNETFDDAAWQEVSQDLRFRQAVSHAINRQEIIDSIYYGYAKPAAASMGDANVTYDVDAANKLLDDMGMKKGADGFRMSPSGKPLSLLLECGAEAPDLVPVSDLVGQYLKAIGLNVTVKQIDSSLRGQKTAANQIEMYTMWSNDQGWGSDLRTGSLARAGQAWDTWRTSLGKSGVEPPAWAKQIIDLDAKVWQAVPGSDEFNSLKAQGVKWTQDNLPYINFVEQVKYPMIVNKHLMNVPTGGYAIGADFAIPQMFYDNGKGGN
jgi:peptide/nickel transport system substrate-binding protein